jgi:hypothetical protein
MVTLTGYAYETIPGKSITAGQTQDSADDPTASLGSPIKKIPLSNRRLSRNGLVGSLQGNLLPANAPRENYPRSPLKRIWH